MTNRNVLIVESDREIARFIEAVLAENGFKIERCYDAYAIEDAVKNRQFYAVLADMNVNGVDTLKILQGLVSREIPLPDFLFISSQGGPEQVQRAIKAGAVDLIQKPFSSKELLEMVKGIEKRSHDLILDIMKLIHGISGITLGEEKRSLVETRLYRRTRSLNLNSLTEYYQYFKKNRDAEIKDLVSIITTHTTEFFRESSHFDYLFDRVFPRYVREGRKEINIWSAASSSGEEAYSIAISYLEFLRMQGLDSKNAPILKVLGSDIDSSVVAKASRGIYAKKSLGRINDSLGDRYFDQGTDELVNYVRVKDSVHRLCKFVELNLIGRSLPDGIFDVIFLRNVLIYFKPDLIAQIVRSLGQRLANDGSLVLGHSENLNGLDLPFESIGDSIFRLTRKDSKQPELSSIKSSIAKKSIKKKVRVFIIDDSETIRSLLKKIFLADSDFVVVGEAEHPKAIKSPLLPSEVDVVTLDIHMPVQDGVSYLRSIQGKSHPPVIMFSSVNFEDGVHYINCLELGAVDYIEKPSMQNLAMESERIRQIVKSAALGRSSTLATISQSIVAANQLSPKYTPRKEGHDLILLGASTGGVEAIKVVLQGFPKETPPIIIVQHIPELFSRTFAQRLNMICVIKVSEAVHDEILEPNHAYIAPGGRQLSIVNAVGKLRIVISDDPPVNRHRPSVDFLFESAARLAKSYRISAALLTGMGADGAQGLLALRNAGCHTVAQNEETSVVFGMPKVAIELGAAVDVVPLEKVAFEIFSAFNSSKNPDHLKVTSSAG